MPKTEEEICIYEGVEALEALIEEHYNKDFSNTRLSEEQREETNNRIKRARSVINDLNRTGRVYKRRRLRESNSS